MAAPMARVLPPAPAQKSTTISPRLASSNKRRAAASLRLALRQHPRAKHDRVGSRQGLPCNTQAPGRKGVERPMPASLSCVLHILALVGERVDPQVQGSTAVEASTKGQNPSPTCAFNGSTNHSGRLCRWRSNKSDVWYFGAGFQPSGLWFVRARQFRKSSGFLPGLAWRFCCCAVWQAYLADARLHRRASCAIDSEAGLFAVFLRCSAKPKMAKRLSLGPEP
jgi:hypothetical protein